MKAKASDVPKNLLAVQTPDAKEWCRTCLIEKRAEFLDRLDSTAILKTDGWYGGGQCEECGDVIPPGRSMSLELP